MLLASAVTFDPYLGDVVSTWSAGGSVCAVPRQSVLSLLGEAIKVRRLLVLRADQMLRHRCQCPSLIYVVCDPWSLIFGA